MGVLINRKVDYLRAFYDEKDKVNSDYDYIYPYSIFECIRESLDPDARTLIEVLNAKDHDVSVQMDTKQNQIQAGTVNNIVAFSGTKGVVNELTRINTISTSSPSQTKIPSEKAIVDYIQNEVIPGSSGGGDVSALTGRVNKLESDMTDVKDDINGIESRLNTHDNDIATNTVAISNINTRLNDMDGSITEINNIIDSLDNGILDPDNPNGIAGLADRVEVLEDTSLKLDDFGDKKYIKDISYTESAGSIMITEHTHTVKSSAVDTNVISLTSSDGSITFGLTELSSNTMKLDIKSKEGSSAIEDKVDKDQTFPTNVLGATKINYNTQGLIIGSSALEADDIPMIPTSKITGLASNLASLNQSVSGLVTDLADIEDRLVAVEEGGGGGTPDVMDPSDVDDFIDDLFGDIFG